MFRRFSLVALFLLSRLLFAADEVFDPLLWDAATSNPGAKAMAAFDGDSSTRWDTGSGQEPGAFFAVDMHESRTITRVEVDTTGSDNDFPRKWQFEVSQDGETWEPVQSGDGETLFTITCPTPKTARHFRITIAPDSERVGSFWSIHELRVYGPPGTGSTKWPAIRWRTVKPKHATRDVVVAGLDIRDFGIEPEAGEDATTAIRLATRLLARAGGGTLWMPAGRYKITEPLELTNNVTIRGDWSRPEPGRPIVGTIFEMLAGRGEDEGTPAVSLHDASAVVGLAFWYPEQDPAAIVPYPVTVKQFGGVGMSVENVTFVNAYRGFACGPEGAALFFLRNVHGTVLKAGIKIDATSDIGRMERVRFSPEFWAGSGLPGSPAAGGPHAAWMKENGTGVVMRRNDWSYAYDVALKGYAIGFNSLPSLAHEDIAAGRKNYPNGNNARFRFIDCRVAIQCEDVANVGMMFHDTDIEGAEIGILAEKTFTGVLQLQHSRISARRTAVELQGPGQILFTNCAIDGPIVNPAGYIGLAGCTPLGLATKGSAPGIGETVVLPAPEFPKLVDPYTTPEDRIAPPTDRLVVVTAPPFSARGDAKTDDTAAVKRAITAVAKEGGTVFFPAGEYRITQELVVPTGVELRGVSEGPHHSQTMGSIIDIVPGRGDASGAPFLTLSARSGLRGLTFHYPEQDPRNITPYPWMIRGAGEGVWVINVSCTFAYSILDLATHRCDNHYIDYVGGHALREAFRVGGGSTGGRLINCQLNAHYYAFTRNYANSPNKLDPEDPERAIAPVYAYAKDNAAAFVIADCSNQILFQNFVFGTKYGLVLTGAKEGPSGWCLGHGSDQCRWGIYAERLAPAGMPLINNQLVTVDGFGGQRGYIALDPKFNSTLYCLGIDNWGGPSTAFQVAGGKLVAASVVIARSGSAAISLRNRGTITLSNAVLHDPDIILERDSKAQTAVLSGAVVTRGAERQIITRLEDLSEDEMVITVPGSFFGVPFEPKEALPRTGWSIHARAGSDETSNALDGNPDTRWSTNRPAERGDEIILEMDRPHLVSKVRIDTQPSGGDYPRRFQLFLSMDGRSWGDPVYSGRGEADLRVGFTPRQARYLRLVNLAKSDSHWSIHEVEVAGK